MSSMRTWSPNDLLRSVQKIRVCMYDTSNSESVIPVGEQFYINQTTTLLDTMLRDLGVDMPAKKSSKLGDIQSKVLSIELGLFGSCGVYVEDPTLQDVILKTEAVYGKLYKREGPSCTVS